jgi:hypothetical protein
MAITPIPDAKPFAVVPPKAPRAMSKLTMLKFVGLHCHHL